MTMALTPRRAGFIAALALAVIAWLSPLPDRVTDRGVYERTAALGIVPDCTDLHCFRLLVAWTLGPLPGESEMKWTLYALVANVAATFAVFHLALAFGLTRRGALVAGAFTAFGFGSLFTLHDPFTSDPLMYALSPLVLQALLRDRVALAGLIAAVGVLAKEFVAAPLFIGASVLARNGQWSRAARVLVAANTAFIVWLVLQLTLIIRFNYGYGDNPSTHILSGGYLFYWFEQQSIRGALSALLNEFGVLYLLAPAGLFFAPPLLRQYALASLPVAALFAYVQQPDRALWNFHFIVTPLAALVLERVSAAVAWTIVGTFAFANLRIGAQLPWVPAARFALLISLVAGLVAIALAARSRSAGLTGMPAAA
jgi:hypothetical protein